MNLEDLSAGDYVRLAEGKSKAYFRSGDVYEVSRVTEGVMFQTYDSDGDSAVIREEEFGIFEKVDDEEFNEKLAQYNALIARAEAILAEAKAVNPVGTNPVLLKDKCDVEDWYSSNC